MIVNSATYRDGKRTGAPADLSDALDEARSCGDSSAFLWLGLYEPEPDELGLIAAEFGLHPLAVEDASKAHQRPKLDRYEGSLFVVFKTLQQPDPGRPQELGEVSVFLGDNFVITVRHGELSPLHGLRERVERKPQLLRHGPSAVLYAVADAIVDSYADYAVHMQAAVDDLETEVFSPERGDYGSPIYALKRNALAYNRAVSPLSAPVMALAEGGEPMVAPSALPYFKDVSDHVLRVVDAVRDWNQLLDHMLDADLARVSVQQNNDMRRISAWAAILAVPTMIAGIYGMNFKYMPELDWHWSYPVVLAVIFGSCLVIYLLLKRSKWL